MHSERSRHERFIEYVAGLLSELQPLPQWVVWKGELEAGKRKKVLYNPHYYQIHARASVKIPKSWESLSAHPHMGNAVYLLLSVSVML